jgi:V/A-type H+-transporting ATPase subunit E
MEKISEAVVDKVRVEAKNIIKEAERKAWEEIEKAKKLRETKLEEEKRKMLEEAEGEAARILAQASMKARQELLRTKADIVAKIIEEVRKPLSGTASDESHLLRLIKEAMDGLGVDKGSIYVSPKDVSSVQKFLEGDKELANRVMEVREFDCMGGVIAEGIEEKVRIDNTYETRLEMLLPKLLPEISKELFEVSV